MIFILLKLWRSLVTILFKQKTSNCNYFALKPPCVGVFTTHTTRQKSYCKIQILFNYLLFNLKKMKKNIFILALLFTSFSIFAQQENHYTMFMYNKIMYNPAFAGSREVPSVMALYRNQWITYKGAPQSQLVNFDTPMGGTRASLGVQLSRHTIGIQRDLIGNLAYSYALVHTKKTSLRLGISGSYRNYSYNFNDPTLYIRDGVTNDPSLTDASLASISKANVGAGAYFDYKNFYIGVSVPNIYQNSLGVGAALQSRHYYAMMGALLPLTSKVQMKPAVSFRYVKNIPMSFDANLMFIFMKKFHVGGSFRLDSQAKSEGLDVITYIQVLDQLGVGLSYDLSVNKLSSANKGSIEALIRYDLRDPNTVKGKFDNPRFFF